MWRPRSRALRAGLRSASLPRFLRVCRPLPANPCWPCRIQIPPPLYVSSVLPCSSLSSVLSVSFIFSRGKRPNVVRLSTLYIHATRYRSKKEKKMHCVTKTVLNCSTVLARFGSFHHLRTVPVSLLYFIVLCCVVCGVVYPSICSCEWERHSHSAAT